MINKGLNNTQKKCLEDMLKSRKNYNESKYEKGKIGIQKKLKREKELNKNIRKIQEEIE